MKKRTPQMVVNFEFLKDRLTHLPEDSGVYLMKNLKGDIVYVGKARSLRNRVRSYFTGIQSKDIKTQQLVREIHDFDIILTKSETEAILLERTLIRHHHPRYNVMLKDGKEYPYIRINFKEEWPRIEKVRRRVEDGAFYLGPFSNAGYLNTALKLVGRIFPLIRCSRHEFKSVKRVCNYYHMKMCLGPCHMQVDREQYLQTVRDAAAFIMGKNKDLADEIKHKMNAASKDELYEKAALYRDQLLALREIGKRQAVVVKNVKDADVIGIYADDGQSAVDVLVVRDGKLIGNESFLLATPLQNLKETLESFLIQYYDNRALPGELIVPCVPDDQDTLIAALGPQELKDELKAPHFSVPQRGPRHELMLMAEKNARYHFDESHRTANRARSELEILQGILNLPRIPERIECVDISNLQGTSIVGSVVCFVDGHPSKENYRHYTIKSLGEGEQNDFASISEVVYRRIERGLQQQDLPDLLVIDGGKAQLGAALKAAKNFPGLDLNIIGLAKSRVDTKNPDKSGAVSHSYERIFMPGEELSLPLKPGSPEFRILTRIRDEAHRFAILLHRSRRSKKFVQSDLDDIPGVGPVIKKRLLQHFGGVSGLESASLDELLRVKGVSEKTGLLIRSHFDKKNDEAK